MFRRGRVLSTLRAIEFDFIGRISRDASACPLATVVLPGSGLPSPRKPPSILQRGARHISMFLHGALVGRGQVQPPRPNRRPNEHRLAKQ